MNLLSIHSSLPLVYNTKPKDTALLDTDGGVGGERDIQRQRERERETLMGFILTKALPPCVLPWAPPLTLPSPTSKTFGCYLLC